LTICHKNAQHCSVFGCSHTLQGTMQKQTCHPQSTYGRPWCHLLIKTSLPLISMKFRVFNNLRFIDESKFRVFNNLRFIDESKLTIWHDWRLMTVHHDQSLNLKKRPREKRNSDVLWRRENINWSIAKGISNSNKFAHIC